MKLNSKRSKTESGRNHVAYATKSSKPGSKLEPFMKLNSKRSETESGRNYVAYATKMIQVRLET